MSNVVSFPFRKLPPARPTKSPLEDEDSKAYAVRAFLDSVEIDSNFSEAGFMQWGRDLVWEYVVALASDGDDAAPALPANGPSAVILFLGLCDHKKQTHAEDTIVGGSYVQIGFEHVMEWVSNQLYVHPDSSAQ